MASVLFLAVLAISPAKDLLREWKRYKRAYVRFAQSRPDTKRLLADFHPEIDQIWIPEMGVVDRCTTCHQGHRATQPRWTLPCRSLFARIRPSLIASQIGDARSAIVARAPPRKSADAHETTLAWEQPILPVRFIQASCGTCHRADLPQTPQLDRGRQLLAKLNCVGCHRLQDIERPEMLGPDLTNIGTKVSRAWIYKWLKDPRTVTDERRQRDW